MISWAFRFARDVKHIFSSLADKLKCQGVPGCVSVEYLVANRDSLVITFLANKLFSTCTGWASEFPCWQLGVY